MRELARSVARHMMMNMGVSRMNKKSPRDKASYFSTHWKGFVKWPEMIHYGKKMTKPNHYRGYMK